MVKSVAAFLAFFARNVNSLNNIVSTFFTFPLGVIHIVRTYKGGGVRWFKVGEVVLKDRKISKVFLFCTKEAITLPFIIVYGKV